MPTKKGLSAKLDEQENQVDILAEQKDMDDELEENVGVPPRKVTEEEFLGADEAFDNLVKSEEVEIERTPFRPGKDTIFVLTANQKSALRGGLEEMKKYIDYEIVRHGFVKKEANQKIQKLYDAMQKIMTVGVNGLSEDERNTVNDFNNIMNTEYGQDYDRNLIHHIDNYSGPIGINKARLHRGLDMLGSLIGVPATYDMNRSGDLLKSRTEDRLNAAQNIMSRHPDEAKDLEDSYNKSGIDALRNHFENVDPEIKDKLDVIAALVGSMNSPIYGKYRLDDDGFMRRADSLGGFLTTKGENGKANYDTIVDELLKMDQGAEKKKAFDMLLGQLNGMCDLDIGVPYAIEAKEEYEWNKKQKREVNKERIHGLDAMIFGPKGMLHPNQDADFLESVKNLSSKIQDMIKAYCPRESENNARMGFAYLGFGRIVEKVKNNSGFNHLEDTYDWYIDVLDFGKNLNRKQHLPFGGEKTLYECLVDTYQKQGGTKEELDATLQALNKKLGIKMAIPGLNIEGQEEVPIEVPQSEPYVKKIKEVQHSANRIEDRVQLKMALASVLALRRMSVDPAHMDHTKVRSTAAYAKAMTLMETDAFEALTKEMNVLELAKKINHPGNFDKEFVKKIKELDEAKYEKQLEKVGSKKLAASARNAARKMDKTGNGIQRFGIRWGKNSGMYDRAVLAMQQAAKNPDPATTLKSVQTVKEYLSNKMLKRSSPSGKERWHACMEFLHEAMPEAEFKAYCDQINQVRKAKENSSDYVKPDQFIPEQKKVRSKSMSAGPEEIKVEENSEQKQVERKNSF